MPIDARSFAGRARTAMAPALLLLAGCGEPDDAPPRVEHGTVTGSPGTTIDQRVSPCEPGTVRECKVTLPEQNGVRNCFVGLELCVEGRWGECVDEDALEDQLRSLEGG